RIAGCSSGIEPHFALAWWSNVLWKDHEGASSRLLDAPTSITEKLREELGDDARVRKVLQQIIETPDGAESILKEHGLDPAIFRTSMTISPEAHVRMQAVWQNHVTNSVSKTINLPNSATIEDVKDAYMLAWETGCKAVTVYRDGSKSMQVLETGAETSRDENDTSERKEVLVPRQRPTSVIGVTDRIRTGHGNMYVNITFDEDGKPFEVFTNLGKAGGCDSANLEAVSRLVSLALRSGIRPDEIVEHLQGITCCPAWDGGTLIRSAPDAVAHALSNHLHADHVALQGHGPTEESKTVSPVGPVPLHSGGVLRPQRQREWQRSQRSTRRHRCPMPQMLRLADTPGGMPKLPGLRLQQM
ncbi:MAG: TSCPD domain-containing protein, partial [Chloroflexi bacterium]|nr:TSCPD domain-containing protein [Chloroflexota bacterium]